MAFSAVIGHESTIRRLQAVVRSGRLAHGYIFAGPEGVGKTLVATELARAALCEGSDADACGRCPSCRKFDRGNHPGFEQVGVSGAGKVVKIATLRDLRRSLSFGALEGERRFVLIEPADRMTDEASNAFLKTLEEPPEGIVLILITPRPSALLDTIVSRCQMVRFAPVPRAAIVAMLVERCGASPDAALFAAAMSDGCPGKALGLLDSDLAARRDDLMGKLLALRPDSAADLVEECTKAIGKREVSLTDQRQAARGLLALMLYLYRDILAVRWGPGDYPLYSVDRRPALVEAAAPLDPGDLLAAIDLVVEAIGLIDANVNLEILLDDLLGRIAQMNQKAADAA